MTKPKEKILNELLEIIKNIKYKDEKKILNEICLELGRLPGYDWVGFYMLAGEGKIKKGKNNKLRLTAYAGVKTEHVNINIGEGICGTAAEMESTIIVPDVSIEKNYLSCSPKVKSEIVVPIFRKWILIGEIDIDSHKKNNFDEADRRFLEEVAEYVGRIL